VLFRSRELGVELRRTDHEEALWVGRRRARDEELDTFSQGVEAFGLAIQEAARQGFDGPIAGLLPQGLGPLADLVGFTVGPNDCGKDLDHISALDFARSREGTNHLAAGGYGAFLARLADGLPILTGVAVSRIDHRGPRVTVETSAGRIEAGAVIVTASTDVLARGTIRFDPPLPVDQEDALGGLSLGVYERVVLELPGNPFRFRTDEDVYFARQAKRTLRLTTAVDGTALAFADFGGSFAEELTRAGPAAATEFAVSLLVETFGGEARKAVARSHATAWRRDPWIAGSFSCAEPGHGNDRGILRRPIGGRVRLAGEATHPTLWGTVGGAYLEGERAAGESLAALPR
jgi:monoamine oxidase